MSRRPQPVVVALGSNLGDRHYELRRSIHEMARVVRIVRVSPIVETAPVDAPAGSGDFLNTVVAGWTRRGAAELLEELHRIEAGRGRNRGVRNAPRRIDLDLILYGAQVIRTRHLHIPHPRFMGREFVMAPLRALNLGWVDPVSGTPLDRQKWN